MNSAIGFHWVRGFRYPIQRWGYYEWGGECLHGWGFNLFFFGIHVARWEG